MTAALIALDWGTTSLRAYLLGPAGAPLAARAGPWGVMQVPNGDFAAAVARVADGWPAVPAIACGMVGSAQGWREAPYVPCPADADALAAALVPAGGAGGAEGGGGVHIVPGVARAGDPPDMMRGEETQVVGALALRPALAGRATLLLPGTHAKWVDVADGRVVDLATYVTGELFAVLRDHSILGRAALGSGAATGAEADAAFARGVCAARDAAGGVAPLLFSARSLVLAGRLPAAASLAYLSGLLIGDELRAALGARGADRRPSALVGEPALCARYAAALRLFGVADVPVLDGAAPAGLWALAERAGLVVSASGAGGP